MAYGGRTGTRPTATGQRIFLITMMLGVSGTVEAPRAYAWDLDAVRVTTDTVPAVRRQLFERRVVFSPTYLKRIFSAALDERSIARFNEQTEFAAGYAERYGITQDLAETIVSTAIAEGLDPELGFRMIRVESVFQPNARGRFGALGLTQLMPSTARAVDSSLRTEAQILDPIANLRTGFRYLRRMIERYGGDVRLGLLAYNRGEGTVDRVLRSGEDPENGYSTKVLGTGPDRYEGEGLLDSDWP